MNYNNYMGGVDRNDQLRQYYSIRLKGRKCYNYIWWFIVDLAITNSYILHKYDTSITVTSLKDFRINLAKELIGTYNSRKRRGRHSERPANQVFNSSHFPKRSEFRRRCHFCLKRKMERHETIWYSETCQIHLCHNGKDDDCFLMYHNGASVMLLFSSCKVATSLFHREGGVLPR